MSNLIYIASPYSSPIHAVREDRAYQVAAFAAHCFNRGLIVYCPIASWHWVAQEHSLPTDAKAYERLNFQFSRAAQETYILKLDGWEESKGVMQELIWAKLFNHTIRYFDGDNFAEVL